MNDVSSRHGGNMRPRGAVPWTVAAAAVASVALGAEPPSRAGDERARRIHASLIGMDSHIDTLQRVLNENVDVSRRQPTGHVDLPRLKAAGMVAPFFALWVPTFYKDSEAVRPTLHLRDVMQFHREAHSQQIQ